MDATGEVQDALGRRGLARVDVRHDADVARQGEAALLACSGCAHVSYPTGFGFVGSEIWFFSPEHATATLAWDVTLSWNLVPLGPYHLAKAAGDEKTARRMLRIRMNSRPDPRSGPHPWMLARLHR
jgi:hypothetical protein